MKLVYEPPDADRLEFDFEPAKLMSVEAEAIEDLPQGKWETFEEFGQMFLKGSARAHKAALWIMMRRSQPGLKFTDLNYPLSALRITLTDDESARFLKSIQDNPNMDDDQKKFLVDSLNLNQTYQGDEGISPDLKDPSENSEAGDSRFVVRDSLPGSEN
jgi:hypothetical protein